MAFFSWLSEWSSKRSSWLVLLLTATALEAAALIFQHVQGYAPCVMCIYQRNAIFGILLAGLLVLIANTMITRLIGYLGWITSAVWGLILAREHLDIITTASPFIPCEIEPRFPEFMPLHEWIPQVFQATGFCNDDSWQFMGWGMAQWMIVVFSLYILTFAVVFTTRIWMAKRP
ncbi:disulfide bond formation protein DsbB [Alteromonas sediminis]|uniref:Disulfide bond formation protein B n=1 Tax=Alteromonas sediminis TaxID=2259342 RepID=A0A3N5Y952_9ALTE|nr:disulfide bond formation protein DsbB [Alteromonas sediminis]RPJ65085.1 disulfide bond formation protein DsbB [Alteromonas sediminis]